jgi:hypothetical protein
MWSVIKNIFMSCNLSGLLKYFFSFFFRPAKQVPAAGGILTDPFGMGDFGNHDSADPSQQELENAIGLLDKRLLEMKVSKI